MPERAPLCGRLNVTSMDTGDRKGTASFIGREETPDFLGRTAPFATNATRPCSFRASRIAFWSSARKSTFSREDFGQEAASRVWRTQSGRKSNKILISSPALMVRPLAGKPISIRTSTSPFAGFTLQALRSKISCPGRLMPIRPLLPEPLALKEKSFTFRYMRRSR